MSENIFDIIVPVSIDPLWQDADTVAEKIRYQYLEYGFTKYALYGPNKGWRAERYPTKEHYLEIVDTFVRVKELLQDLPVECGWIIYLTIKTGAFSDTSGLGKGDGALHPFGNCPTDIGFRERLLGDIRDFVSVGKPAFLLLEDDYTLSGSCLCDRHLKMFSRRVGKDYGRAELLEAFAQRNEGGFALMRSYRELMRDTLAEFAKDMRSVVDQVDPAIPFGYCQSGGVDYDGDSTEAITKALAGAKTIPFVRLYGTFYCGIDIKKIPEELYHMLYSKQHMDGKIRCYHESDVYPHNQYFASAKELKTMMGIACSYGFYGGLLWTGHLLGMEQDETSYGRMVSREKRRFEVVAGIAKNCGLKGVQVGYDPFLNTTEKPAARRYPLWAQCVGRFGIPYTTEDSEVCFLDVTQAKGASEETVLQALGKVVFLDGDAAKALCEREFGKYLGVNVGEDMAGEGMFGFDLGAREVVRDAFLLPGEESEMPIAHAWCPNGNGKGMRLEITEADCEEISGIYNFKQEYLCPGMTRFHNELGGTVIVMGLTLEGNQSQALYNYTRQNVLRRLVQESIEVVVLQDAPNLFMIANEAESEDDVLGMLTIINLSVDTAERVKLHLPTIWEQVQQICTLNPQGDWEKVPFERNGQDITIRLNFAYCGPVYLLING